MLRGLVLRLRAILEGGGTPTSAARGRSSIPDVEGSAPSDLARSLASLGVRTDGPTVPLREIAEQDADRGERRRVVDALLEAQTSAGRSREQAVRAVIRGAAYEWMNRLLALRCLEARGLIDEVVRQREDYGGRSLCHQRILRKAPALLARSDEGIFLLLERAFEELAQLLPDAFPSREPLLAVRPTAGALSAAVSLLSGTTGPPGGERADDELFRDPATLGWAYQHWHAVEREELAHRLARDPELKIDGPRIAVATQYFSEPYMVRFLVDESFGSALGSGCDPRAAARDSSSADARVQRLAAHDGEDLRLLDPACGSGHFLLGAFDALCERVAAHHPQWDPLRVAEHVAQQCLFGIDIDPRAVQIAAACLWMKVAERGTPTAALRLHLAAAPSALPPAAACAEWAREAGARTEWRAACATIADAARLAEEVGSLLRVDAATRRALAELARPDAARWLVERRADPTGASLAAAARMLELLDEIYDVVVANPPYVDKRDFGASMRSHLRAHYPAAAGNTYAAFIVRALELSRGLVAMVTPQTFLFVRSYERLRRHIGERATFEVLCQLGSGAFDEAGVDAAMFVLRHEEDAAARASALCTFADLRSAQDKPVAVEALRRGRWPVVLRSIASFQHVEGLPFLFGAPDAMLRALRKGPTVADRADVVLGMKTSDNRRFVRYWWELGVARSEPGQCTEGSSGPRAAVGWAPYVKQANGNRFAANALHRVRWCTATIHHFRHARTAQLPNERYWFREGLAYGLVSQDFTVMRVRAGHMADMAASCIFPRNRDDAYLLLGLLNSSTARSWLAELNPTVNFQPFDVQRLPLVELSDAEQKELAREARRASNAVLELRSARPFDPDYDGALGLACGFDAAARSELTERRSSLGRYMAAVDRIERIASPDPADPEGASGGEPRGGASAAGGDLASARAGCASVKRTDSAVWELAREAVAGLGMDAELVTGAQDDASQAPSVERYLGERAADLVTSLLLRWLGGGWPLQGASQDAFGEPPGFVSLVATDEGPALEERLRALLELGLGARDGRELARQLEARLGSPLGVWIAAEMFPRHVKQLNRRPILWQLSSKAGPSGRPAAFSCLLHAWQIDADTLPKIRTQLVRARLERLQRELEGAASKARCRAVESEMTHVSDFGLALEDVERSGFECALLPSLVGHETLDPWCTAEQGAPLPADRTELRRLEARYRPNRHDGVRVNLAPLELAGLLPIRVLGSADARRAVDDRAHWRASERTWCRDGLSPAPSWWSTAGVGA